MSGDPATGVSVLVVVTSTSSYVAAGYRTGLWLEELTRFHAAMTEAGHEVTIASIRGGEVPIDPESVGHIPLMHGNTRECYADPQFMSLLADTSALDEVADDAADVLYLPGGHGTMFDFPSDADLDRVVATTWQQGGIVAAVGHGVCGLLGVSLDDDTLFLRGREVTGFSWAEEKLAVRADVIPFRLDEALRAEGAIYTQAVRPMAEHLVRDGNLVTGQNPATAKAVAREVTTMLEARAEESTAS